MAVADYLSLTPKPAECPISESLWGWNDFTAVNVANVVEVLRAAAVIEAAKENADVREQVSA